jgi:transcriptional regulator with XRE-family HTH domain
MAKKPFTNYCNMVETILTKISIKRLEKKFSQDYMALRLNISQSYYNKIENGKKEITLKKIIEIATILNIDIPELFNQKQQIKISIPTPKNNKSLT